MKKILSFTMAMVLLFGITSLFCGCNNKEYSIKNPGPLVGTPTDYSQSENWFKTPQNNQYDIDVIYFNPTLYTPEDETAPLICNIDDQSMRNNAQSAYDAQASVFETVGNIYIPFYRQVDFNQISIEDKDNLYSYISREPRTDVFAALDYYFQNYNNGKPFILAGDSQGSMMLSMILSEYMKKNAGYCDRMVVAYQIGYSVTKEFLQDNPHLKFATGASDTGVVVSFNTEAPSNLGQNSIVVLDDAVCINPITWTTEDTHASKSLNKGSKMLNSDGTFDILENFADAKIKPDRGTIVCTSVNPDIYAVDYEKTNLYGPGSYHYCEYGLYYMNIRENATNRVQEYLKSRK